MTRADLAPAAVRAARHSPYSDPGPHAARLAAIGTEPAALHRAATRTIRHYRAEGEPTAEQLEDIDLRLLGAMLDTALGRLDAPFDAPRTDAQRLGGCCRDRGLLAVAVLREHGIPARTRVGFADYLDAGYRTDHVVVERWEGGAWHRSDPAFAPGTLPFDADWPTGEGSPFETAAEAWTAYRDGRTDLADYGVGPGVPLGGPWFVQGYVIGDVAHRFGAELLLWDLWGAKAPLGGPVADEDAALADELAALTIAADAGDGAAEARLARFADEDARVRPGARVTCLSPNGRTHDDPLP